MQDNLFKLLIRLFSHVSVQRRYQFLLMLGMTLFSSITEVVSLGAVVPFISILTQPERAHSYPMLAGVVKMLETIWPGNLILSLTIAFAMTAIVAAGVRLLLLWFSLRLANATGADLSIETYRRTLYQPYSVHMARHSSEIISGITQKVATATTVLISFVTVATAGVLIAAILSTLLFIDPLMAAVAMVVFGAGYGAIAWLMRYRLMRNSQCIAQEQTRVVKALQEGLGAIRDVLLDGAQAVYCEVYRKAIQRLQRASGENAYMNQFPRYAMEGLGLVMVSALVCVLSQRSGGVQAALPKMAALALGMQRLLPLLQQLYGNWTVVAGSRSSLMDVLNLLDQPLPDDALIPAPAPLVFSGTIHLDNIRFRYGCEGPWVLDGIDLIIRKGERIGFVGSTGSGKSTALDIVMGLLEPAQGQVLVDGRPITRELRRAWHRAIAHVPQSIFLADTTIAENIAFGVPFEAIDMDRVRQAAAQAQMADFVESRPGGYTALVGERGIRLSGGQRQRLGIARALYKQSTVLVLDEATSALDSVTEKAVMSTIEGLSRDLTILIIAHRLSTLESCDRIVRLESGRLAAQGSYEYFADGIS